MERVLALELVQTLAVVGDAYLLGDYRGDPVVGFGIGPAHRDLAVRRSVALQQNRHGEKPKNERDRREQQSPIPQVSEQVLQEAWNSNLLHGDVLVSVDVDVVVEEVVESVDVEPVRVEVESEGPLGVAPAVIP